LFPEVLDWSSLTLPAWGMMRNGELWERTTPVLPTAANEFGSEANWPTPRVKQAALCPSELNRKSPSLDAVVRGGTKTRQMYPTPLSTDATHGGPNQRDSSGRLGLTAQAIRQTWPTPNASDCKGVSQPEGRRPICDDDLPSRVNRMWPTPRAGKTSDENEESWKARNADGQVSTPPLTLAVKMWATPTASTGGPEPEGQTGRKLTTQVSGQLNPDWVEWLMGWPIGWTASAPLATDKFRQWCASHGRPCHD
jgi:hypothetical protein